MHVKLLSWEAFFSQECSQYHSAAGSRPDPLGSLQRSPDSIAGLRGAASKESGRSWNLGEGRIGRGNLPALNFLYGYLTGCTFGLETRVYSIARYRCMSPFSSRFSCVFTTAASMNGRLLQSCTIGVTRISVMLIVLWVVVCACQPRTWLVYITVILNTTTHTPYERYSVIVGLQTNSEASQRSLCVEICDFCHTSSIV